MQAYGKNCGFTLESIRLQDVAMLGVATTTVIKNVASVATYGVSNSAYTGKLIFEVEDALVASNAKIRVLVGGVLKKEITYTTNGFKEDMIFPVNAEDVITIEAVSNAAPNTFLRQVRILIINKELKDCDC